MEQLYMLLDENFIVLLRAESKNPVTSRGTVHTKIKYKQIVDSIQEKRDPRNLIIMVLSDTNPEGYIEKNMFFEDSKRCKEIKELLIEGKKAT